MIASIKNLSPNLRRNFIWTLTTYIACSLKKWTKYVCFAVKLTNFFNLFLTTTVRLFLKFSIRAFHSFYLFLYKRALRHISVLLFHLLSNRQKTQFAKQCMIRISHAQIKTFVRSLFFSSTVRLVANSIIATIEKTKYDDIKSIRLLEIFEIVFAFVISRLKSIAHDSFISKFVDFSHVCRVYYDEFSSNNDLHSHLRASYSFSSNRDYWKKQSKFWKSMIAIYFRNFDSRKSNSFERFMFSFFHRIF